MFTKFGGEMSVCVEAGVDYVDDDGDICYVKKHCSSCDVLFCRAIYLPTASDVARCWNASSRSITSLLISITALGIKTSTATHIDRSSSAFFLQCFDTVGWVI